MRANKELMRLANEATVEFWAKLGIQHHSKVNSEQLAEALAVLKMHTSACLRTFLPAWVHSEEELYKEFFEDILKCRDILTKIEDIPENEGGLKDESETVSL